MEKNIMETPIQRQKLTKEEILERKISMVKERGSRVMKINSPLGSIMFNVLRQFDQAYAHFKGQLGEPGGISHEEGAALMDEAREITIAFSEYTGNLSKKVRFKYFMPQELQEMRQVATKGKKMASTD
ncbi:MAG: recombinase [Desulfobacteraceae bacterium]|nr:recombinase [Desulfobacteraceae bacterium]